MQTKLQQNEEIFNPDSCLLHSLFTLQVILYSLTILFPVRNVRVRVTRKVLETRNIFLGFEVSTFRETSALLTDNNQRQIYN